MANLDLPIEAQIATGGVALLITVPNGGGVAVQGDSGGVNADGDIGIGVKGTGRDGIGVHGTGRIAVLGEGLEIGVEGQGSTGVRGKGIGGTGVVGESDSGVGVSGANAVERSECNVWLQRRRRTSAGRPRSPSRCRGVGPYHGQKRHRGSWHGATRS